MRRLLTACLLVVVRRDISTGAMPISSVVTAVLLHAISEDAKRFYLRHGFTESPVDPMTMMVSLAEVENALGG